MAAELLDVPDDLIDAQAEFMRLGIGDGLPLIPPTEARVEWMLSGTTRDPEELIGIVPPRKGRATVRRVAVNAVMAGALPAYMPVILAAMEAVSDPVFNIGGVNATGHNCGPLIIVSGPIVRSLDINAGMGLFGPGWRANATIGRAVRLCMLNIAGARPGEVDRSVHGHPGKYTYCIGEDPAYGPWTKLNEDYGAGGDGSVVMVLAAEAPHSVAGFAGMAGFQLLTNAADACSTIASNKILTLSGHILVVLGPYNSEQIFAEGWSKRDVQMFMFEHVRRRVGDLRRTEIGSRLLKNVVDHAPWLDCENDDAMLPLVEDPDRFIIMATPGENSVSSIVPTWSLSSVPVVVSVGT